MFTLMNPLPKPVLGDYLLVGLEKTNFYDVI